MRVKSNTCILVVRGSNNKLIMGGDRRITMGWHWKQVQPKPKVFKRNGVLLGGSGESQLCELVTQIFNPPNIRGNEASNYIHTFFYPKLMNFLRHHGLLDKENYKLVDTGSNPEDSRNGDLLVGVLGSVFLLGCNSTSNFITEIDAPASVGCGGDMALGAYLALKGSKLNVKQRLVKAMTVAASLSPGCDSNIDIIEED